MSTKYVFGRLRRMAFMSVFAFSLFLVVPIAAFAQFHVAQSHPLHGIYQQTNLVSDLPGMAPVTDPNLVNPWGLVASPTSPWWISDNNAGKTTLYNGQGQIIPLVATIPGPTGSPAGTLGTPTGIVFNSTTGFVVSENGVSAPAAFIFSTEDGTIAGWSGAVDRTHAILAADRSTVGVGAVYKGLAIGSTKAGTFIYATNFRFGTVDVFDSTFKLVGSFTDHYLPKGYAPFGIQNIGGRLYVTFALQDATRHDDVKGKGHGFVDVFNTNGKLLHRLISRGKLDSPWGLALAPANYGAFSNALLVGNFGDGFIDAYKLNGSFLGRLSNSSHAPIVIDGLWGLSFGNGAGSGGTNELFFTAGIQDESHGLFGKIDSVS